MIILIVDDERNIRLTLRDILEDEGYQTLQAESGEEALAIIAEESPGFVILDVKLPGIDGVETFKKIKKDNPTLDVLMISGHSNIETAVDAVRLGAYDFLEKPPSMAKILTAARNVREKQKLITRVQEDESVRQTKNQLIGTSPQIAQVREVIAKAAPTESKILIRGESGTGKELVAFSLHQQSRRSKEPYIQFNSAAIPTELVESELFGYEKGAFTGADSQKKGKLELADGGTIFLDEIGDMSLPAQSKILRVMQEGTFERVGGNTTLKIDVRIIAATHKNLEKMIKKGTFREDLFYRLNIIPINIPPLRERTGDVKVLAEFFLGFYSSELKIRRKALTDSAMNLLDGYPFPGNVRELKNLIERLYILTSSDVITDKDIAPHVLSYDIPAGKDPLLKTRHFRLARREFEIYYLTEQLNRFGWKISTVAEKLGMRQPNLSRKIKELGIRR